MNPGPVGRDIMGRDVMGRDVVGPGSAGTDAGTVTIDLNSDLGEGYGAWTLGDDDALLDLVTSANVACGFHAGDPSIMRRVCTRAADRGVAIGAQIGYRDLAGFGRRAIDIEPEDLIADVIYQIGALDGFARAAGSRVSYVKPHGALYNTVVTDADQAAAVVAAVTLHDASLPLLGLPGSQLLLQAQAAGLAVVEEAFADRAYTPQGHLVSRRLPGAMLHDPAEIADRCVLMAMDGFVIAEDGSRLELAPGSLCVHGDTPDAVAIARLVRSELLAAGVTLSPFVPL